MTMPFTDAPVGADDVVRRIAGELTRLCHELRATERVLFPIVIGAGSAPPGSDEFHALQRFDALMQSLDGLSDILADVSDSLPSGSDHDVSEILSRIKLAELSVRLLGDRPSKSTETHAQDAASDRWIG
jgi:hypothetical protein